jgi:hypothetical protein
MFNKIQLKLNKNNSSVFFYKPITNNHENKIYMLEKRN